jgi:hypothetical protein
MPLTPSLGTIFCHCLQLFFDHYVFVLKDDRDKDDIPKPLYQVVPKQADLSNPSLVDRISEQGQDLLHNL